MNAKKQNSMAKALSLVKLVPDKDEMVEALEEYDFGQSDGVYLESPQKVAGYSAWRVVVDDASAEVFIISHDPRPPISEKDYDPWYALLSKVTKQEEREPTLLYTLRVESWEDKGAGVEHKIDYTFTSEKPLR